MGMRLFIPCATSALLYAVFAIGCDSRSPSAPSVTATPRSVTTAVPTGPVEAELSIAEAKAIGVPIPGSSYHFAYAVTFALVETSGRSGATIQNIATTVVEDSFSTGPSCWVDPVRVGAGGTLRNFGDRDWMGYCAPDAASASRATSLTVAVTFTDDHGAIGGTQAIVPVTWSDTSPR